MGFVIHQHKQMKRQRQDAIALPVDAWTVIASFAAVEDILAVLSLTRAIRSAILDYLLDMDHFELIDDALVEKAFAPECDNNVYFQIYMELFRLFAVHMRGDIKYPVANIRDLLAWILQSQVKHNLVTFVRLVLLDKRMKDKEYQNVVLDVAAQCNQAEIVKMMLESSCIKCETLERALRRAIENAYTETLRVLIDDKRTPFMQKHNLRELLADYTTLGIVLDHRRFFENSRLLETLLQECSPVYPVSLVRFILWRCSENGFSNQTLWYIVNRIRSNAEIVTELVQVPNFIVTKKMFDDSLTNEFAAAALVGGVAEPTIDWNDIWRQSAEKKHYNVLYALTEKRRSSISSLALQEVLPLLIDDLIFFSTTLGDDRVDPSYDDNKLIKFMVDNESQVELYRVLLQNNNVDPGVSDNYVLQKAITNGDSEVVRLLVRDPRVSLTGMLMHTIGSRPEIVQVFLESERVDPCENDCSAIKEAIRQRDSDFLVTVLNSEKVEESVRDKYYQWAL
jgi:hypothetical protein